MKVFSMNDSDCGNSCIVVAEDLNIGISLYKKTYGYYPERIQEMTADGEGVIIQGLIEPERTISF